MLRAWLPPLHIFVQTFCRADCPACSRPQARVLSACYPPLRMLAGDELAQAGRRVRFAIDRILKQALHTRVDWTKVGLCFARWLCYVWCINLDLPCMLGLCVRDGG